MGKAVQYRGRPAILKAFDNTKIATWALSYTTGRQIVGKHAGSSLDESREALEELLKALEKGNTTADYTLSFYEDINDRRKIRASLEPDISYNVVLFDNEDNPSPAYAGRQSINQLFLDRLETIEAQLALRNKEPEADEDVEEEAIGNSSSGIMGMINKAVDRLLGNPNVQERLGEKIFTWVDQFLAPSPNSLPMSQSQPAAMGNTGMNDELPQISEEQASKIQAALTVLARVDDKLGDHLEHIAKIAQANPKKYHSMINMLNIL